MANSPPPRLERRFYDRVAQTARCKTPGMGHGLGPDHPLVNGARVHFADADEVDPSTLPPWLKPPKSYKPTGRFADMAAKAEKSKLASTQSKEVDSAAQASGLDKESAPSELARTATNENIPRTESALEQLARTASAAKFVEDIVNGDNPREAGDKKLSQTNLQGSFEALMSLDIQSVENLVELAATNNSTTILHEQNGNKTKITSDESRMKSSLANMESFIKSLSSANLLKNGLDSSAALSGLLQASSSGVFDAEFMKRVESSTGFSKLRVKDGLPEGAHKSVEDFLSLVASGDIPHQDPNLLQIPLQKVMSQHGSRILKRKLSQQQLVALATRLGSSAASKVDQSGTAVYKRRKKK
ncbi:hypothetical protein THAOC_10205 [Thalassiosira oceanica]|uniref:Uncharacterized protein n=1 Tax=Thalassiosira oceanica TaxID=159749 RepID=K0TDI4_THAOC|nr:hypothetical protein THAOC_10205 [Thalassiosira oceanica]|eukprot:EJK68602.1 hypothetical protein THAOC_10205 [Thalassiosira oceanica]